MLTPQEINEKKFYYKNYNNIRYTTKNYSRDIGTEKIAEKGSDSTVYIECLIRKDKLAKINKQKEKN